MSRVLVVLPSVPASTRNGRLYLDRKAADGLGLYAKLWPGPVRCLMREGDCGQVGYGDEVHPGDLPFEVAILPPDPRHAADAFRDAAVVLAAGDNHLDFPVVDVVQTPVVFIIEYTLATRLRIIRLGGDSRLKAAKSVLWTLGTEVARRRAFRRAAGLQCNGTPAFSAYRTVTPSPLLFFDTRTTAAQLVSPPALAAKQAGVRANSPLRLAFSGRLEPMKGADHLLLVAEALVRQDVAFTLDIYGDGSLRDGMASQIVRAGLESRVRMHGPVPFNEALIPALIDRTDLFLCCHRQADPSCTYMETLSCGVPIVGYDNAAFVGVLTQSDVGRAVPMDRPAAMAAAVKSLDRDRATIAGMMAAAAAVGRAHDFETVFAARIAHLRAVASI